MNLNIFIDELKNLNIILTEKQIEDLRTYKDMLREYNKLYNLTAITTDEEIYLKHFYDSLTLTKVIDLNDNLKVLDIGSGAGFPGLVLKIVFPNLDITLLDSNNKKITFLNDVINRLKLKSIKCIKSRAEELDNSYREYFDIVTSRAVASLRILSELSIPYLKVNGYFIAMKGRKEEEIEDAKVILKELNSKIEEIKKFTLPDNSSERMIVKIIKELPTDKKYPRKYDQIKREKNRHNKD